MYDLGVPMSSYDQISPGGDSAAPSVSPAAQYGAVEEPKRRSWWRALLLWTLYGAVVMAVSALVTWKVLHAQALPSADAQLADVVARMDLKSMLVDTDQLEIYYPEEWQVIEREHGARLVIQEPMVDDTTQPMGVIMYPKNITIARIRGSVPIDFAQKLILEEDLRQGFGTRSRVRDYVVQAEKGEIVQLANAKVIKMPATFTLNGIPMSQLNILASGERNSYLISYVDASANYVKDYARVWQGLSLLKTTGGSPFRYTSLLIALAIMGAIVLLMALASWWQSKRVVYDYENDLSHLIGDSAYDDDSLGSYAADGGDFSPANEWRLDDAKT